MQVRLIAVGKSVSVKASSCLDSNLIWANKASCDESSSRLLLVGMCTLSSKIAWSLADIFSINSMASSGVFNFIFPLAEASKSCLDCGLNPSMKITNYSESTELMNVDRLYFVLEPLAAQC